MLELLEVTIIIFGIIFGIREDQFSIVLGSLCSYSPLAMGNIITIIVLARILRRERTPPLKP